MIDLNKRHLEFIVKSMIESAKIANDQQNLNEELTETELKEAAGDLNKARFYLEQGLEGVLNTLVKEIKKELK